MDVKAELREYLIAHHWPHGDGSSLTDTTPLFMHGILDSLAAMQLVSFLETRFGVEFSPQELDLRRLETIEQIQALVIAKLESLGRWPEPGAEP